MAKPKQTSKMKKMLAAANKKFKKVSAADAGGFSNEAVEDGSYTATVCGAELKEVGGKPVVMISYEITAAGDGSDSDAAEEVVSARYFLETDTNLAYLKRDLGRFAEIDEEEFDLEEQLQDTLEAIVDAAPEVKISVRMAGEFQNVYLNKVDVDGSDDEDDDEDDDDKPAKKGKGKKGKKPAGKKGKKPADDEDDDDEDDDDDDAPELEKGDTVSFKPPRAKKAKLCEVKKIKGDKATIEDEDGTEYTVAVDRLEVVDPDEDDDDDDDDDKPAKKGKKGAATKKGKKGKKPADDEDDDDEDDDDDDDDEDVEIDVGSKVSVTHKGKECPGKVKELDPDEDKITVRFKFGKEHITKTFPADKVEAAE